MTDQLNFELWEACRTNNLAKVRRLLHRPPSHSNINWGGHRFGDRSSPLHISCENGNHKAIELLLAHPGIDPNNLDTYSRPPVMFAFQFGRAEAVRVMLQDKRVQLHYLDSNGRTCLWWAAYKGNLKVIQVAMNSVDLLPVTTADVEIARSRKKTSVEKLLQAYIESPEQTREDVAVELGVSVVVRVFALVVFLSDEHLAIRAGPEGTEAKRFFAVAMKLPMELQMVLCFRAQGSGKENIPSRCLEPALRHTVRSFLQDHS